MKFPPKLIVQSVYKTPEGIWRGFCSPYDVTCEAKSKQVAIKRLESLVKLYEEGLVKYSYPQHLSLRALSDKRDQVVLDNILKKIVAPKIGKAVRERYLEYQKESDRKQFSIDSPSSCGYYYQPTL